MVITPHALVGSVVGSRLPAPLALLAGVASHYLLDRIPHRDYRLRAGGGAVLAADALTATLLVARRSPGARAGALGGVLPDLALVAGRALPCLSLLEAHRSLHERNHTSRRLPAALEVGTQLAVCALALAARPKAR